MWTIIDPDDDPEKAALADLDEPLELEPATPALQPAGRWVWQSLLALTLTLSLGAQYVFYNFASLSQNPDVRPWLETLCRPGICTLRPLLNLNLVRSEELSINSHPEQPDMLLLQMRFRNLADHAQALPAFDLVFSNMHGEEIAGRRFFPGEYLSGIHDSDTAADPAEKLQMPAHAEVMASLAIVDPGEMAVNYEITFVNDFTDR